MTQNPITTLIVDDEPLAREYISRLLKTDSEIQIVGEACNGLDAVQLIGEQKPDLIFLDVQMPEIDGFAVLKTLGPDALPAIIFTTAYEQYAIRAFEFHALDYLLKPFDSARFAEAVWHAKGHLNNGRNEKLTEDKQISEMLKNIDEKPQYLERLLIKSNGRIVFLKTREIDLIKAEDKYVHLYFGKSSHLVRQSLSQMKKQLDPQIFAQIHRSIIINVERIKELQTMFNGEYNLVLENGAEVPLSRNYKNKLFDLIGKPL